LPSNESDEDTIPHPKEDFYGKNIPKNATVRSTITSLRIVEKYLENNLQISLVKNQQQFVNGK